MKLSLPIASQYVVRSFRCWVCMGGNDYSPDSLDAPDWLPAGSMVRQDCGNGVAGPLMVGVFR